MQTLYHGTDMSILKMSDAEREKFKRDCINAIDYMWQFILPLDEEKVIIEQIIKGKKYKIAVTKIDAMFQNIGDDIFYNNIMEAIICNKWRLRNNNLYLYDYTYLTTIPEYAADYAQCSWKFGEIGQIAYRFFELIEKIKPQEWNPSDKILDFLNRLRTFASQSPEPVIVKVSKCDLSLLYPDTDGAITEDDYDENGNLYGNFCYKGKMKFSVENAFTLKDFAKKMSLK